MDKRAYRISVLAFFIACGSMMLSISAFFDARSERHARQELELIRSGAYKMPDDGMYGPHPGHGNQQPAQ